MNRYKKALKKLLTAAVLLILAAFVFALIINIYVSQSVKNDIFTPDGMTEEKEHFDCILILGAGLRADGSPSLILKERLSCGLTLYNGGVSDKIIVSGDHSRKSYDEVNAMKNYLTENGVPEGSIFMDHAGFSTYESMYRAKEIFECESVCIVTQKYHLFRSVYIAKGLGLDAKGVFADRVKYRGFVYRELRECAARVKDFLKVIIRPLPTYLGEHIPVSTANAALTNG